jgi:hypothetical protein
MREPGFGVVLEIGDSARHACAMIGADTRSKFSGNRPRGRLDIGRRPSPVP